MAINLFKKQPVMTRATLFISDIHLDRSTPHTTQKFFQFLENCGTDVDALYILGDLFESYLTSLLLRYANQPDVAQQVFAKAYLNAMQQQVNAVMLQDVGDQCLLFAGLFPASVTRKTVKINYFVDMGQSAYSTISKTMNDLFWVLASKFIILMDVLQSIRPVSELLPLQAYEQWNELGSKRAYMILKQYSGSTPFKK